MKRNRFLALAMAGAMTLTASVPAFAADGSGTTEVSLTVAPKNTYTLTVPAATTLDSDGEATQLSGGIKITGGDLEDGKKLTVTATSDSEWKMSATGKETSIGYALYSDAGTTEATTWEFTQAEANAADGATKAVYAKADAEDLAAAASGSYSDVITFTAEVADAVTGVTFTLNGASYTVNEGTTWAQFIEGNGKNVVMVYSGQYVALRGLGMLAYNGNVVGVGEQIQNGGVYTKYTY